MLPIQVQLTAALQMATFIFEKKSVKFNPSVIQTNNLPLCYLPLCYLPLCYLPLCLIKLNYSIIETSATENKD